MLLIIMTNFWFYLFYTVYVNVSNNLPVMLSLVYLVVWYIEHMFLCMYVGHLHVYTALKNKMLFFLTNGQQAINLRNGKLFKFLLSWQKNCIFLNVICVFADTCIDCIHTRIKDFDDLFWALPKCTRVMYVYMYLTLPNSILNIYFYFYSW